MEIVSPICFIYSYATSPLGGSSLSGRQHILALAYLIHYTNRAIISPLITPSRSKASIIVPLAGVTFNIMNGNLMGAYIASPQAQMFLISTSTTMFTTGLVLWAAGFVGNIQHDMILMNIRRNPSKKNDDAPSDKPRYAIPFGALFKYVSFPNYFSEWVEWLGYAVAASPLPAVAELSTIIGPTSSFFPSLTPPWIFLFNEVMVMFPRAYRGHRWYKRIFGDQFPTDRKIVVPFIL